MICSSWCMVSAPWIISSSGNWDFLLLTPTEQEQLLRQTARHGQGRHWLYCCLMAVDNCSKQINPVCCHSWYKQGHCLHFIAIFSEVAFLKGNITTGLENKFNKHSMFQGARKTSRIWISKHSNVLISMQHWLQSKQPDIWASWNVLLVNILFYKMLQHESVMLFISMQLMQYAKHQS